MRHSPEYRLYCHAKERCNNPNSVSYKYYGARGVKFLFRNFEEFFAELGIRPIGLTVDRIRSEGNYEPGNVRWATMKEQASNKRK